MIIIIVIEYGFYSTTFLHNPKNLQRDSMYSSLMNLFKYTHVLNFCTNIIIVSQNLNNCATKIFHVHVRGCQWHPYLIPVYFRYCWTTIREFIFT